jgi:hypothetical protein
MKMSFQWFGAAVLVASSLAGCVSALPETEVSTNPQPAVVPAPAYQSSGPSAGPSTNLPVRNGKAIVRSEHGNISFSTGGTFRPLRVNMEFPVGTTIKSEADAEAYLQVNGFTSTVKVGTGTVVEFTIMDQMGGFIGGDSVTEINLKVGTILGSVRKISANSSYVIHTPNGTAAIRGTDFQITAEALPGGKYKVTYTCVTGQMLVTATVDGNEKSQNLMTGQSWTPGGGAPTIKVVPDDGMLYPGIRAVPIDPPPHPPPPPLIQPFNGNGPPNPAVNISLNPYIRVSPPPPPPPPPNHH